jgi:hypothetical protein
MEILNNSTKNLKVEPDNLATKIFLETCCKNCDQKNESAPVIQTDNMGRDIYWDDMGTY